MEAKGNLQYTESMSDNFKSCSKGGKCRGHGESWRRLMTICEKWYFFLGLGRPREKEYFMHNPNFHLDQRSFSSALLNLHFVCAWIWQVTMDRKREKETPAANTDRLCRFIWCYCYEILAVIEADPTLPSFVFIALGFHITIFTPLRYILPV